MPEQTSFRALAPGTEPVRVVVVGAGGMGRGWIQVAEANNDVAVVGVVDVNEAAARDAVERYCRGSVLTGTDAIEIARKANADAIIDVTIPEAHYPVTMAALLAGYPVLGEKPVAATVAEGLSLVAAAQLTGQLFMVSQSRRYNHHLRATKALADGLGPVGVVKADFYKSVHFGGFRDEMDSPLLLDMAIHQFDMARYLLSADPVAVSCEEYNPGWSWYQGHSAASAVFEMDNGARFLFNGSWCSPGAETSWNGAWRVSTECGTVIWDGDNAPERDPVGPPADTTTEPEEIAGALVEFVRALRTGAEPMGRAHENVLSFAMVEAAIRSSKTGARVMIDQILEESWHSALQAEGNLAVREVLTSWPNVRVGLRGTAP